MGIFSSKKTVKPTEPKTSVESREALLARGTESVEFPGRRIAGLTELELGVERQAQARLTAGPSPEREAVIQEFLRTATTPVDVANLPELQGIFKRITELGELEANRLGRATQIRGTAGTTGGRDILARNLTDVQERLVGAAAPFLIEARGLKAQAGRDVGTLTGQREFETAGRLGAAGAVGFLRRDIEQAKLDADLSKILADIQFRFQTQPQLLQAGLVTPGFRTSGGGPSELQKIASAIGQAGQIVGAVAGGPIGAATIGANTLPIGQAGPTRPGPLTSFIGRR